MLGGGLPAILSMDVGLELMSGPYPHSQVKDWDEATMVTCGSMLQLPMAGRKSYDISFKLKAACDPQFPHFSSPQQHVCQTGWCPHSQV